MDLRRVGWMVPTVVGGVMACLAASALRHTFVATQPPVELGPVISQKAVGGGDGPWEAAIWQAGYWRGMAHRAAHVERYRRELPDEPRLAGVSEEPQRRAALARDHGGHLRRARAHAILAITHAHTDEQRYASTLELTRIEHDAGQHRAEYRLARTLMAWRPADRRSAAGLLRAARCNGKMVLAAQLEAAFPALTGGPR